MWRHDVVRLSGVTIGVTDASNEIFPGSPGNPTGPYGLGFRVPLLVISPWSKGGWVCSEVFDHTSLIQFMSAASHRAAVI